MILSHECPANVTYNIFVAKSTSEGDKRLHVDDDGDVENEKTYHQMLMDLYSRTFQTLKLNKDEYILKLNVPWNSYLTFCSSKSYNIFGNIYHNGSVIPFRLNFPK